MPKKTKKQKIKAELRRKQYLLSYEKIEKIAQISEKKRDSQVTILPDTTVKSEDSEEIKSYFKHDLKKSLIIILAIIALEIVIYFCTIIKYFK